MEATLDNRDPFNNQREALLCLMDMDETTETRWIYKLSLAMRLNKITLLQFEMLLSEFEKYATKH